MCGITGDGNFDIGTVQSISLCEENTEERANMTRQEIENAASVEIKQSVSKGQLKLQKQKQQIEMVSSGVDEIKSRFKKNHKVREMTVPMDMIKPASTARIKKVHTAEIKQVPMVTMKLVPMAEIKQVPIKKTKLAPTAEIKQVPSVTTKLAPTAEIKQAPTAEIKKAPTAEIKKAPTAEIKKVPMVMKKVTPQAEIKQVLPETLSDRRETVDLTLIPDSYDFKVKTSPKIIEYVSLCENPIVVTEDDCQTLNGHGWLSDPIVDFYLDIIHQNLAPALRKDVFICPSLFMQFMKAGTWPSPPVNIFDKDKKSI